MLVDFLSSAGGGIVGGLVSGAVFASIVSYKLGRWQERVENRLASVELRLNSGNGSVAQVPLIQQKLDTVIVEIAKCQEAFTAMVPRTECDLRHKSPSFK